MNGRFQVCLLFMAVAVAVGSAAGAAEPRHAPAALLNEALELAGEIPERKGYGDWRVPLLFLRIGQTMRLHGLADEAIAAIEQCRKINAKGKYPPIVAEIAIALCRELTLLGRTDEARRLADEITFRNYRAAALMVTARSAWEAERPAEAEAVLRKVIEERTSAEAKRSAVDDLWVRAMVRLAVGRGRLELARALAETLQSPFWRSAGVADVAVTAARSGRYGEALQIAGQLPDPYMAAMALSRLAVAFSEAGAANEHAKAIELLKQSAGKIKRPIERDFALRMAARRLAAHRSAEDLEEADSLAAAIEAPCLNALARCDLVRQETLDRTIEAVERCPEGDRQLLWEVLAVSAARRRLTRPAFQAARRIARPWQRLRARCALAGTLAQAGAPADAAKLLEAAAQQDVERIDEPGWRVAAHLRLAMAYDRAGRAAQVDRHLRLAAESLSRFEDADVQHAMRTRLAEALITLGRKDRAAAMIRTALRSEPPAVVRDRLVLLLAEAAGPEAALEEHAKQPLTDEKARRLLVYRAALAGKLGEALQLAQAFRPAIRAEALVDIARAQVRRPVPKPVGRKAVGVCLHGSWGSWFPRLERMGVRWELMPFFEPYEVGADGLAARYVALGYPGTGGHFDHLSPVGVEHVREYLYSGGGFLGICAGQFLATGARYVNCDTHYMRGQGPHQVQMRKDHLVSLGLPPVVVISRRNGGMLLPKPGCEVIGWYDKVDRYAALVAEQYGRGRVVAFSPHPEGSSGLTPQDRLCINALNWAITGLP